MRTVLLIDYEPRSIGMIRSLLCSAGLRVRLAADGSAGVDAFRADPPDMVLVQDLIPGKHGFDVCREIKGTERGKKTPLILIATPRDGRRQEIRDTGCDAFVDKPLRRESLLRQIRGFFPEVGLAGQPETPIRVSAAHVAIPVELGEEDIDRHLDTVMLWDEPASEEKDPPKARASTTARKKKKKSGAKTAKKTARKKRVAKKKAGATGTRKSKSRTTKSGPRRKRKSGKAPK